MVFFFFWKIIFLFFPILKAFDSSLSIQLIWIWIFIYNTIKRCKISVMEKRDREWKKIKMKKWKILSYINRQLFDSIFFFWKVLKTLWIRILFRTMIWYYDHHLELHITILSDKNTVWIHSLLSALIINQTEIVKKRKWFSIIKYIHNQIRSVTTA